MQESSTSPASNPVALITHVPLRADMHSPKTRFI